jgi:hypothetical protein
MSPQERNGRSRIPPSRSCPPASFKCWDTAKWPSGQAMPVTPQVCSGLVDPQQSPQMIYSLSGTIMGNDESTAVAPSATVEILDGDDARESAVSNQYADMNHLGIDKCHVHRASVQGWLLAFNHDLRGCESKRRNWRRHFSTSAWLALRNDVFRDDAARCHFTPTGTPQRRTHVC